MDAEDPEPAQPPELGTRTWKERVLVGIVMPSLYSIFIAAGVVYLFPSLVRWTGPILCGDGDLVIDKVSTGSHLRGSTRDAVVSCVGESGERAISFFSVFILQYPVTVVAVVLVLFGARKWAARRSARE